jgi:dUTP pyrophosphatase
MKFIPKTGSSWQDANQHPALKVFKENSAAFMPEWGTEHAACFDLRACLPFGTMVNGFMSNNQSFVYQVGWGWNPQPNLMPFDVDAGEGITIRPGDRVMIPTGLIFDIPVGYKIDVYSRSGLSLKKGLVLVNGVGKIDSDYVDPMFILIHNISEMPIVIHHGDRIAQAEMLEDIAYEVIETTEKPQQKTDRVGGMGSTGVK